MRKAIARRVLSAALALGATAAHGGEPAAAGWEELKTLVGPGRGRPRAGRSR